LNKQEVFGLVAIEIFACQDGLWIILLNGRKSEDFVMSNDLNLRLADGGLGLRIFE